VQTNRTVSGFNLVHLFDELPLFDRSVSALAELAARDEIHPVVGEVFPFHDVGRAHAALQSRQSTGKLVLRVDR
jgi:NADPH:quinone reductase-like Zn-dependent oxidoreductase